MQRKLFLALLLAASIHPAFASTDDECYPVWAVNQTRYNNCSNLPFLSPGNDSRVSLSLLLLDQGHGSLQVKPLIDDEKSAGYSGVPFTGASFSADMDPPQPADAAAAGDTDTFSTGDASRCQSNAGGTGDFINALNASQDVPEAERKSLADSRQALPASCDAAAAAAPAPANIQSATGKQFASYLAGAAAFYGGNFDEAMRAFASLADSPQPWLKEASRYMAGRVQLNRAQQNAFGDSGLPDLQKVDMSALDAAQKGFEAYLRDYPSGRYAASARGLMRRVYWLADKPQQLADEYEWQFAHAASSQHNQTLSELVQEVDSKLLAVAKPDQIKDPLLLAAQDLTQMRARNDVSQITSAALQSQQPLFAGHETLYAYLLAAHAFYVEHDPAGTLKHLPQALPDHSLTYLDFSAQTLRGLALEQGGDWVAASKLWLQLMPLAKLPLQRQQLQLSLAINYERSGNPAKVFAANTPIDDVAIREILLRQAAGRDLLLERIHATGNTTQERHLALYVLLYKDLMRMHYADFIADYALLPADVVKYTAGWLDTAYGKEPKLGMFRWPGTTAASGYACPAIRDVAQVLQQNPHDPQGLNCMGDFVRISGLDGNTLDQPYTTPGIVLGAAPPQFQGALFSRQEGYKDIIMAPATDPAAQAYALYRAVNCYGPSHDNSCGGKDVAMSTRKVWFQALKSKYADTRWAQALKYYW